MIREEFLKSLYELAKLNMLCHANVIAGRTIEGSKLADEMYAVERRIMAEYDRLTGLVVSE